MKSKLLKWRLWLEMTIKTLINSVRPETICEEPGCWEQGRHNVMQCRIVVPKNPDDPSSEYVDQIDTYCIKHVQENGYCWGCGEFWAGVESFDFNRKGLCPNCKDDPDYNDDLDEVGDDWGYDYYGDVP